MSLLLLLITTCIALLFLFSSPLRANDPALQQSKAGIISSTSYASTGHFTAAAIITLVHL
jgi:hypothetical protein